MLLTPELVPLDDVRGEQALLFQNRQGKIATVKLHNAWWHGN
jgi:hypothetical protein